MRIGVLHQNPESGLDLRATPLAALEAASPAPRDAQIGRLARVGISLDAAARPIASLSPGLKVRLALLLLIVRRTNVLVLDEVTNSIDRSAKEVLLDFLPRFHGAVLAVAHDRELLEAINWTRIVMLGAGAKSATEIDHDGLREWMAEAQEEAKRTVDILLA